MRRLILLLLLLGAAKPPAAPLSAERVVTGDGVTAMTVNGEPVRVLADPAAPGLPLLTQAVADRLGLKLSGKLGIGFVYSVGPTRVSAATKVARTALGGKPEKQRVAWTGRRFSGEVDGTVGPAGLPDAVVRFVLRDARPGERTFALPIEEIGFPASLFGGGWSATYALLDVGGKPMRVRFDPRHPRSLATATAATRIARIGGGALSG